MPLTFRDDNEARAAIYKAADESGLSRYRIAIQTFSGANNNLDNRVQIEFPLGRPNGTYHAMGAYDEIIAAIRESQSFDELVANCAKRELLKSEVKG